MPYIHWECFIKVTWLLVFIGYLLDFGIYLHINENNVLLKTFSTCTHYLC